MSGLGPAYPGGAPHSRGRHTPTSEAAAKAVDPTRLGELQKKVLARLLVLGAEGATADELAEQLSLWRYTVAPRLRELDMLGWIEDSGTTRTTPRGGASIVWRALAERRLQRGPVRGARQRRQEALEQRVEALEEALSEVLQTIGGTHRRML